MATVLAVAFFAAGLFAGEAGARVSLTISTVVLADAGARFPCFIS